MGKFAGTREIEDWREHYWQLIKHSANKEIAAKLGVDPAYLSKIARGAKDKKGKPKNPGTNFLKKFYMIYPNFQRSPDNNENEAHSKTTNTPYDHEQKATDSVEEARLLYMHRTDELLDRYKTSESFLQSGLNQVLQICTNMSETQKESVINQGLMIKTQDKMADSQNDTTKSLLLWAETNRDQYSESRKKTTKSKDPSSI